MPRYSLPQSARGIESPEFAIEAGKDKVVFILKSEGGGRHYTLHAGPDSGVIDLHETTPGPDGHNHYRRLFALPHADLPELLNAAAPLLAELLGLLRPLRLGWLAHHHITIARGVDPVSDHDIAAATRRNRRRRLIFEHELWEHSILIADYLEDVYDFPDGNFALLKRGHSIGIGFKTTDTSGRVRFMWIKRRNLTRFIHRWAPKFSDILDGFVLAA